MRESGKKTVLYIGYITDLLSTGKIKKPGDEVLIIKMVKKAYPHIVLDDIMVESKRTIPDKSVFSELIEECESGKIEMVVIPSLGSLGSSPVDVFSYIRRLQKANPSVKILFALEEMIHPSDDFEVKAQVYFMMKDEYARARKRKRDFINV